ncbi:two-component regulator propeller domain-containing protein [Arcicella lustrica]|uniref:Two-component regulator propeller domain-containing protein n=1 Tax=Arcicella lustrica TaxID=2984196 RepID=A0ABU5SLC8_9BACT|nr:two-component regulator propeller domain-containing protein [Arcicella sp. DC25W]MEA5428039.1 two-component regulator propeller domain-containing protein [Arcicella sp. DC25W]
MKIISINIVTIILFNISAFSQTAELFDTSNTTIIDNDIWEVSVDKNGTKYLGTIKFGLVKFKNGKFTNLNKNNSVIKGEAVTPIFTDSKGNIWLKYSNPVSEIAKFDGKKWTVFTTKEIPTSNISAIAFAEDKNGNIYFGGENGVFCYNKVLWSKVQIPEKGITVRAMDINKNGEIAIGHNSGLIIYSNGNWKSYYVENSELQLSVVRAVKYNNNKLFIGYGGGIGNGGFSILENDKWTHFNKLNSKVPDHMVRDIEVDKNGTIWMATNNGLIKMSNNLIEPLFFREGIHNNNIWDIATEGNTIWIATNFGLIKMTQ